MSVRSVIASDIEFDILRVPLLNGSSDSMVVDGSSTPVDFKLNGQAEKRLHIHLVRFVMRGKYLNVDSSDMARFGDCTAKDAGLTNGFRLFIMRNGEEGSSVFYNPVKMLGRFLDYADEIVNLVNAFSSNVDYLRFDVLFPVPVRLEASDSLVLRVQDDVTDLACMHAICSGGVESL